MTTPEPASPRLRDAASLLPALGAFLLMPPVITLFAGTDRVWGVPLIVAYLFGVWLALIAAAALLSWRLGVPDAAPAAPAEPAEPAAPADDTASR